MAIEHTAAEIESRFETERDYIQKYVEFVQARSTIHDQQIWELNRTLDGYRLPKVHTRKHERIEEPFSPEEIVALLDSIQAATPDILQAIRTHEDALAQRMPLFTPMEKEIEHLNLLGEWVDWVMQQLSDDPPPEIEQVRQYALRESRKLEDQDEHIPQEVIEGIINDAIEVAMDVKARGRLGGVQYVLEQFEELRLTARVATPDAEINVLRQGFILLMTAFDAAIFDLMRVNLRKDFFGLIGEFGKREKVTLQEIGDAGNFEAFREQMTEKQLKKCYLKDLLFLLESLGVRCIERAGDKRFIHLIELVLRRNVHVHNRGVVDERYLERDQNRSLKYNIYHLASGDIARIDEPYWELANQLCTECVNQVATWAGV